MTTLILAAGYATRLYPLSKRTPKALFMVRNAPVIDHILRLTSVVSQGPRYVITNNKFYDQFIRWSQGSAAKDVRIINDQTDHESQRLGAVGDIHFFIEKVSLADDLLVIGGDNLFDWQLDDYLSVARSKKTHPVIGIYDIGHARSASGFGVVTLGADSRVVSFEEKPRHPQSSLTSVCIYYFPAATVPLFKEYIGKHRDPDTSGDYIRWLCTKMDVYGYEFKGTWFDIGNKKTLEEAQTKYGR
jgi:glucose-1-phosphate thymidylyltransferase